MRRILHACWPLAAVVMFTVALALQIPRKALFFRPVKLERSVPYASFVEFGESEYAAIMQKVRMSWQVRSHGAGAYAESPIGALDPDDEPPPAPLEMPKSFFARRPLAPPPAPRVSLAPPTRASAHELPQLAAPDESVEARRRRDELLVLPESLRAAGEDAPAPLPGID